MGRLLGVVELRLINGLRSVLLLLREPLQMCQQILRLSEVFVRGELYDQPKMGEHVIAIGVHQEVDTAQEMKPSQILEH